MLVRNANTEPYSVSLKPHLQLGVDRGGSFADSRVGSTSHLRHFDQSQSRREIALQTLHSRAPVAFEKDLTQQESTKLSKRGNATRSSALWDKRFSQGSGRQICSLPSSLFRPKLRRLRCGTSLVTKLLLAKQPISTGATTTTTTKTRSLNPDTQLPR